jgi:DNA-binding helix-hairpin-helix protein with protein kinase domain
MEAKLMEIFGILFSIVIALIAYIWKSLTDRIKQLEDKNSRMDSFSLELQETRHEIVKEIMQLRLLLEKDFVKKEDCMKIKGIEH